MIISADRLVKSMGWIFVFMAGWLIGQLFAFPPDFGWADYPAWKNDWSHLMCSLSGREGCSGISKFPFSYLLNSFFSTAIEDYSGPWVVSLINILSICLSVSVVYYVSRLNGGRGAALAYIAAMLFTVMPAFYIHSGALEVQFGVLLGVFAAAIYVLVVRRIRRGAILAALFISAFLLPLYKDTSVFLMGVVCLVALLVTSKEISLKSLAGTVFDSRGIIIIICSALIPSLTIMLGYNWHRYDSFLPVPYLIEAHDAAAPYAIRPLYFFWTFFSPNGGVLVSWSAALVVLWVALRLAGQRPSWYGILASVGLILVSALILSNWWTPFGWEGWGNRLILPSAMASLIVIASTATPVEGDVNGFSRLISFGRLPVVYFSWLLIAAIFLISIAYIFITYSGKRYGYLESSLWGSDACKAVGQLREKRAMWEFKKTPVHIECHFNRLSHIPGSRQDMSPLSVVEKKKYLIRDGNGAGVIGRGWSPVEGWGVWSDGTRAEIRFIPGYKIERVSIELDPFIYGAVRQQRIGIYLNGSVILTEVLTAPKKIVVSLPDGQWLDDNTIIKLILELPDAVAPSQVGLNTDARQLGVGLRSIDFQ